MNCFATIRRLLAIVIVAGLTLSPLARPAMAGASDDSTMQEMAMASSASADEMAAEMPCCPSKAPAPVDCDKCIYMAGCAPQLLAELPAALALPLPIVSDRTAAWHADAGADGLRHPPPEHPPRTLV